MSKNITNDELEMNIIGANWMSDIDFIRKVFIEEKIKEHLISQVILKS